MKVFLIFQTNIGPVLMVVNPSNSIPSAKGLCDNARAGREIQKVVSDAVRQLTETGHSQSIILRYVFQHTLFICYQEVAYISSDRIITVSRSAISFAWSSTCLCMYWPKRPDCFDDDIFWWKHMFKKYIFGERERLVRTLIHKYQRSRPHFSSLKAWIG